jgi:hypothetical protein
MSIVTLFTRTAPSFGGFQFDAVLEDTLEASVEWTQYPIESGANAVDHGIILPFKYTLTGAISNNPLKTDITDFTGALSELLQDSGIGATIAGLSAGFLSGSNDTRASETLNFLIGLMTSRSPFDLDAGDIQLSNMVISNITRTKTAENEGGLEFVAELMELATLDTVLTVGSPKQSQLRDGDPAKSQAAEFINRGEQALRDAGEVTRNAVNEVLGL